MLPATGICQRRDNATSVFLYRLAADNDDGAEIDSDHIDRGAGSGTSPDGQVHDKRRLVVAYTALRTFKARRLGLKPPIALDDYVRLPHVLTTLRKVECAINHAAR